MAKPVKNKAKKITARAKRLPVDTKDAPKRKDSFDLDAPGATAVINGVEQTAPSLLEAVRQVHRYTPRRSYVARFARQYGCSVRTVDRAIAECEKEWEEEVNQDKPKRVAKKNAIYLRLAMKAENSGDYRGAAFALKQSDELLGDRAPKKLTIDTPNDQLDIDELLAKVERQRKLAEGHK